MYLCVYVCVCVDYYILSVLYLRGLLFVIVFKHLFGLPSLNKVFFLYFDLSFLS